MPICPFPCRHVGPINDNSQIIHKQKKNACICWKQHTLYNPILMRLPCVSEERIHCCNSMNERAFHNSIHTFPVRTHGDVVRVPQHPTLQPLTIIVPVGASYIVAAHLLGGYSGRCILTICVIVCNPILVLNCDVPRIIWASCRKGKSKAEAAGRGTAERMQRK